MASERAERLAELQDFYYGPDEGVQELVRALAAKLSVLAGREHALAEALPRLLFAFAMDDRQVRDTSWERITDDQRQGWVARATRLLDAALARGGAPAGPRITADDTANIAEVLRCAGTSAGGAPAKEKATDA